MYQNLDWKKLHAILLTHVHADHSGGAQFLREATGAKVYVGRADAAILRAGEPREAIVGNFAMPKSSIHKTIVDRELDGGETITIGEARFQVFATPGHTPGSVCYLMERNGYKVLFSGDVIISLEDSPGPDLALPGTVWNVHSLPAPRYRGDARAFLGTLRALRSMPAPDLVLPGHPRMDQVPQSPAMTQERWDALLDSGIARLEALNAHYDRDAPIFLDDTPKALLPNLYLLGEFKGARVWFCRLGKVLSGECRPADQAWLIL